jgi:multidrug resistance efflux pump
MSNVASGLGNGFSRIASFFASFGRRLRTLAGSFRFWVLFLIGLVILLIVYFAVSDRYTPFTTDAYVQAYVVQMAPQVGGQVVRVSVREGQEVKEGDLLFEIDPRPFEHKVAHLSAKQVEITHQVQQLGTDLAVAKADLEKIRAEADFASTVHRQEEEIFKNSSTTERKYLDAVQKHKAAQASLIRGQERVKLAQEALDARVGKEHSLLAQVNAQLAEAKLNLVFTRVVAPCNGIITDLQLRVGAYVHVGQPALTVIDQSDWVIVANIRENSLLRVKPGQPAFVALQARPGHLIPAHVVAVGSGVGPGQGVPSGKLPEIKRTVSWVPSAQRFQVRLTLDDPSEAGPMRVGMTGSVSIFTEDHGPILGSVTRGLHRFVSWIYFF